MDNLFKTVFNQMLEDGFYPEVIYTSKESYEYYIDKFKEDDDFELSEDKNLYPGQLYNYYVKAKYKFFYIPVCFKNMPNCEMLILPRGITDICNDNVFQINTRKLSRCKETERERQERLSLLTLKELLVDELEFASSTSEAKRLIKQGGIRFGIPVEGEDSMRYETVTDINTKLPFYKFLLRKGKLKYEWLNTHRYLF